MPVYRVNCPHCHYNTPQYLKQNVGSTIIKCPGCLKNISVRQIKAAGVVEAEADGVVGYLRHDTGS